MIRNRIALSIAFLLVLGAGIVIGRLTVHRHASWLAGQLDLTAAQQQQMDAIWADTQQKLAKTTDHRRALDRERDQAIQDLLGPAQWAAYGKIFDDFRARRNEVDKEREKLIHDADDRSRALLDDQQKEKWDARSHQWHIPHGSTTRPTTSPNNDRWDEHRD